MARPEPEPSEAARRSRHLDEGARRLLEIIGSAARPEGVGHASRLGPTRPGPGRAGVRHGRWAAKTARPRRSSLLSVRWPWHPLEAATLRGVFGCPGRKLEDVAEEWAKSTPDSPPDVSRD